MQRTAHVRKVGINTLNDNKQTTLISNDCVCVFPIHEMMGLLFSRKQYTRIIDTPRVHCNTLYINN